VELPALGGRARLRVGTRWSVGSAVEGSAKGVKDEGVLAVIFSYGTVFLFGSW
jgi:hypothetical protein